MENQWMQVEILGVNLTLLPEKVVFWEDEKILLVADLHLGKANHFRMAGIPVPSKVNDKNLETMIGLLNRIKPKRTIFLGDLFHSYYNEEWETLGQVIRHFPDCSFELVRGNHDIMSDLQYERHKLKVFDQLQLGPLLLTHEPTENTDYYNIAGHIHPGVHLRGKGRQAVTLPCFYFGKTKALLPAFGSFTGFVRVPVKKNDRVFVVTDKKVIKLE